MEKEMRPILYLRSVYAMTDYIKVILVEIL